MAITALPEATIRLLGSAQVLTTPTSLIKELIDNALDAKATAIDVIITPDTLSKLEVRDNGTGIPQEDLDALGRRGHTSKLRSFEELRFLGGVTLGFRGEALASAAQLGDVSVTTRTDGESVATLVALKATGGIKQQSRTSHPVGTTLRVANFAAKLPVRKKTFEKEAPKTIQTIERLLQAYALARPSIKFSLKVTKGGKGSWSYAPRASDGIAEAVSQVVGRDTSTQCVERLFEFTDSRYRRGFEVAEDQIMDLGPNANALQRREHEIFKIEAFLPRPGADSSSLGKGQYLSIDSRPVSHEKGTMKKMVTLFRKYLRASIKGSSEKLKNPFLRLNIKCPRASYDANVEPAKDTVVFGNESLIMESMEQLFKEVYGEYIVAPTTPAPPMLRKQLDDFEVFLARKPQTSPSSNVQSSFSVPVSSSNCSGQPSLAVPSPFNTLMISEPSSFLDTKPSPDQVPGKRQKWGFDMSNDYTEEVEVYERRGSTSKSSRGQKYESPSSSKITLNPWLIAKMNAPVSRNNVSASHLPMQESDVEFDSGSRLNAATSNQSRQTSYRDDILASQLPISRSPAAPSFRDESLPANNRPSLPHTFEDDLLLVEAEQLPPGRRNDFVSARNVSEALISPPATIVSKGKRISRGPNMPSIPAQRAASRRMQVDDMLQTALSTEYQPRRSRNVTENPAQYSNTDSDLAWAMDFEQRKEGATRRRREELRAARQAEHQAGSTGPTRSSPHKNRYNAAIASLDAVQAPLETSARPPRESFKTTLEDSDPRAYLMRCKKSMAAQPVKPGDPPRMMRAKSMKLPMERIFPVESLYQLLKKSPTDIGVLKGMVEVLVKEDMYIGHGGEFPGLAIKDSHIPTIAQKLEMVVTSWICSEAEKGHKYEVEFCFGNLPSVRSLDNVA